MHNGNTRRKMLLMIFGLTAGALVIWLFLLFSFWVFLLAFGIEADYWAMTEALSTAVAAAAVFGAGFVAYRELSELASTRHMEVADKLFEELNSTENIASRRWVFQTLPDDPEQGLADLGPTGREHVKRVLNSLDRVAFLTQGDWIPDDMIMPWMSPMVAKSWRKLGPWVDFESRRRQEPDYYRSVRELAGRCQAWRQAHGLAVDFDWIDDAL